MPEDLTQPPQGSKFRFLSPDQFGFGRSESDKTVIVDWVMNDGPHAEFSPIRIRRKETHKKYGVFENYSWADTPVAAKD
jgi:hypothetical protein